MVHILEIEDQHHQPFRVQSPALSDGVAWHDRDNAPTGTYVHVYIYIYICVCVKSTELISVHEHTLMFKS